MTQQPSLLPSDDAPLVDDERGRIDYRPRLLEADEAQAAFDALRAQVHWRTQTRGMYGRDVEVPRLLASYRLHEPTLPETLRRIHERVAAVVDARFDAVGLNLYRDQRDSVAPHNDHLYEIATGEPIALVSLGATRPMVISAKRPPRRRLVLELEAGSLLVMSFATQQHYDHGIPKLAYAVGPRISLAFRARPR